MIIDAHVHLSTYTGKGQSLKGALDVLQREMRENDVTHAIVIPDNVEGDPKISDLETTFSLIAGHANLFALGSPQVVQRGFTELEKYRELLTTGKIHGLKLFPGHEAYYPTDAACHPYFALLQELDYPLVIHTGDHSSDPKITEPLKYNDPKYAVEIARQYPKLKVLITHYYWPKIEYCYEITKNVSNIYFELAGCGDHEVLEASGGLDAMRTILRKTIADRPDKAIYGTDWPLCDHDGVSGFTLHTDLVRSVATESEQEDIFWSNANRVYKLGLSLKGK